MLNQEKIIVKAVSGVCSFWGEKKFLPKCGQARSVFKSVGEAFNLYILRCLALFLKFYRFRLPEKRLATKQNRQDSVRNERIKDALENCCAYVNLRLPIKRFLTDFCKSNYNAFASYLVKQPRQVFYFSNFENLQSYAHSMMHSFEHNKYHCENNDNLNFISLAQVSNGNRVISTLNPSETKVSFRKQLADTALAARQTPFHVERPYNCADFNNCATLATFITQ